MLWLRNLILASSFTAGFAAHAQPSNRQWIQHIQLAENQTFILDAIFDQPNAGVLVIGKLFNLLDVNEEDQLIIQGIDANGKVQWRKTIPHDAGIRTLRITNALKSVDGSLFIAYQRNPLGEEVVTETVVTKLNSSGDLIWQKNLSELNAQTPSSGSFEVNAEGESFILGFSPGVDADGNFYSRCAVSKLDANGIQQWITTLDEVKDCSPSSFDQSIAFDSDRSIYLSLDNAVAKLDANGNFQWQLAGRSAAIQVANDTLFATSPQQTWAISKDSKILWSLKDKGGMRLKADSKGLVLATTFYDEASSTPHLDLLQLDKDGRLLWDKPYTASPSSTLFDLSLAADGSIQVFAEIGVRKGLLKVVQPTMALIQFDRSGKEISKATSTDAFSAWRHLNAKDGSIYLGDINGNVEKFSTAVPTVTPPVRCPWFKPFCKL